jgi:hypothetical protein
VCVRVRFFSNVSYDVRAPLAREREGVLEFQRVRDILSQKGRYLNFSPEHADTQKHTHTLSLSLSRDFMRGNAKVAARRVFLHARIASSSSSSSSSSVSRCRFYSSLGKNLTRETEMASNHSQRKYLDDIEKMDLKKRKLEMEREEREEKLRAQAMREVERKEAERKREEESKELQNVLTGLVLGAVSATAYAMHYG